MRLQDTPKPSEAALNFLTIGVKRCLDVFGWSWKINQSF